jgi:hypothetical protein
MTLGTRVTRACANLLFLGVATLCWSGAPAGAQEIGVRAYLSPNPVGTGRLFVLNLEVTGAQSVDSEPQPPDLSSFATYLGSGTSTSMRTVNGRTTVSLTIQLRYQALTEGAFVIPPLQVSVSGTEYRTEPLDLEVAASPPPQAGQNAQPQDPTEIGAEDIFLTAQASKARIREGEPFVVEYRIFTRVNVGSYSFTHVPEPQGFWAEELPLPDPPVVEQVDRNGSQYTTAVIRRLALIPTGSGTRTLEPVGIEAQVRVRRRSLDPFGNFFDRSSLFETTVPAAVLSDPIQLEVEPLPPGRPRPFSGVVGRLELDATLDQDSVDANQAIALTITATGEGNLKAIPEPALELPPDFEVYPPEVSDAVQPSADGLAGRKSWRYVLIPRAPGRRSLPAVSMGYFDTGAGAYRTATTEPLPLLVAGELVTGSSVLVRGGVATLREDIRFIHLGPAGLTHIGHSAFAGSAFWVLLLLPMVAILGSLGLRIHRDRLEGDPAYARQRRAGRVANKRLAGARTLAGRGAPREFYAEVALALRGFVADRLNVAEAGMQMREAGGELKDRGASEGVIEEMSSCLDHCDLQRFAPAGGDEGEEARFLDRVASVMTTLNREVKR